MSPIKDETFLSCELSCAKGRHELSIVTNNPLPFGYKSQTARKLYAGIRPRILFSKALTHKVIKLLVFRENYKMIPVNCGSQECFMEVNATCCCNQQVTRARNQLAKLFLFSKRPIKAISVPPKNHEEGGARKAEREIVERSQRTAIVTDEQGCKFRWMLMNVHLRMYK